MPSRQGILSEHQLDLASRINAFVFEDPGYLMARRCFEASGARCLPAPVDAQGLDTCSLPQDGHARLVYVKPSHQFPLGGVRPITRRQELLQWAQQHNAWIVEDEYDGEFRYGQRPIDALQSIDGEGRVIYVGTFSKALSPQLRLGYLLRYSPRESDWHYRALCCWWCLLFQLSAALNFYFRRQHQAVILV